MPSIHQYVKCFFLGGIIRGKINFLLYTLLYYQMFWEVISYNQKKIILEVKRNVISIPLITKFFISGNSCDFPTAIFHSPPSLLGGGECSYAPPLFWNTTEWCWLNWQGGLILCSLLLICFILSWNTFVGPILNEYLVAYKNVYA